MQKERALLRKNSGRFSGVDEDHVEKLCRELSLDDLRELNEKLEGSEESEGSSVIAGRLGLVADAAAAQEAAKKAAFAAEEAEKERLEQERREKTMRDWDEEEVRAARARKHVHRPPCWFLLCFSRPWPASPAC